MNFRFVVVDADTIIAGHACRDHQKPPDTLTARPVLW
jgi:hypothetical protein